MRAWLALVVVAVAAVTVLALVLGGQAGGRPEGDPLSVAATPFPRPTVDPDAGEAAYVASVNAVLVVLDASGRVVRVGPEREAGAALCPGGRRLAIAESWRGAVEVRSVELRQVRAQRVPIRPVHGVACLDPRGHRTAVVTGSDTTPVKTLRVLAPGRRRIILRTRGEVPRLDASGIYVTDAAGVRQRALVDGRLLARLPGPAGVYDVMPSPDGRHWLMNVMPEDTLDRIVLAQPDSGAMHELPFRGKQALGWVGPEQFAVLGDGVVRIVDTQPAVVRVVEPFPAHSAVLVGDRIMAVDGRSLIAVQPGGTAPEVLGTVPERTYLLAALTPPG